jgi:Protein of unknown function (DUF4242)
MGSLPEPEPETAAFLVERYLRRGEIGELPASVARTARLCADRNRPGPSVEYLQSAYLPTEDTCFCLFSAHSAEAVRAVNREAGFALDRITEAVLLHP